MVVEITSEADSPRPAAEGAESQEAAGDEEEDDWDTQETWSHGREEHTREQEWCAQRLALAKKAEQVRQGLDAEDDPLPGEWCETWKLHGKQPHEEPYPRAAYNSQVDVGGLSYGNWNGFRNISHAHLWSDLKSCPNAMVMAQGMGNTDWERLLLPENIAHARKLQ
jgi:hypothetical protein